MRSMAYYGSRSVVGRADGKVCDCRNDVFLVTAIKLQINAHVHELCRRLIIYAKAA